MGNKRPIVYAPRKMTYYSDNGEKFIGYYVSRAYLKFKGKWYEEDGTISKKCIVDFINKKEENIKTSDDGRTTCLCGQTGVNVSTEEVFKTYRECRKFVIKQKEKVTTSEYERGRAYWYGLLLEEKYITLEDRQQTSEVAKNI